MHRSAPSGRIAAHLGRHIWQAPASSTQQPLLALVSEHRTQAEIGDFQVTVGREEQILRLEISVGDAFIMYEGLTVSLNICLAAVRGDTCHRGHTIPDANWAK